MIGFLFLSLALLAIVFWLIAPVLLGRRHIESSDQEHQNVVIARERLADLELQHQQNEISEAEYNLTKTEIEFALLEDTRQADTETQDAVRAQNSKFIRRATYLVLSAFPFVALFLYQLWGDPDAIAVNRQVAAQQQNPHQGQNPNHSADIAAMLAGLEAKLAQEPNNPNGWYTLGRSYMVQKNYDKAVNAFRELNKYAPDNASAMVVLADALTMSHNGDIRGEPFELAKRAMQLEPQNTTALWLSGLGYQANGDPGTAISLWEKLLPLLKDEPKSVEEVKILIANAREQAGLPAGSEPLAAVETQQPVQSTSVAASTASPKLTVTVSVDPKIQNEVSATDNVMIYAQRAQGMKMPLAMVKVQVKDLPVKVELSDANALMPMNKLSDANEVNIIARISKSGQAVKQEGDREFKSGPYKITHGDLINIEIK